MNPITPIVSAKARCYRFEGRTVLVTAGASGLGAGIAARLADEGATVAVWDLAEPDNRKTSGTTSRRIIYHTVDLLDLRAIDEAFKKISAQIGAVDVLINNAGGSLHTPQKFLEQSDEDWSRVMRLNLDAAVFTARMVLPGMIRRNYGRIVNLGSKAGRFGSLFAGANYSASKGAIQSLTLQLALEFGGNGITCNAVCPGAILTERVDRLLASRKTPEQRQEMLQGIPVGRHGRVEEVAAAVAFLASDEASFVNGAMLDVNGGQAMVA